MIGSVGKNRPKSAIPRGGKSAPTSSARPKSTPRPSGASPTSKATTGAKVAGPAAVKKSALASAGGDGVSLSKESKSSLNAAEAAKAGSLAASLRESFVHREVKSSAFAGGVEPKTTDELFHHNVQKGETLSSIAADRFRQSGFAEPNENQVANGVRDILTANPDIKDGNKIRPEQVLNLPRDMAEGPVFQRFADATLGESINQEVNSARSKGVDIEMARLMRQDSPGSMTGGDTLQRSSIRDRFDRLMRETGRPILSTDARSGVDSSGMTHAIFQAAGIDKDQNLRVHGFSGGVTD